MEYKWNDVKYNSYFFRMRPEHTAPPEVFYNSDEALKYTRNTRIMEIQE